MARFSRHVLIYIIILGCCLEPLVASDGPGMIRWPMDGAIEVEIIPTVVAETLHSSEVFRLVAGTTFGSWDLFDSTLVSISQLREGFRLGELPPSQMVHLTLFAVDPDGTEKSIEQIEFRTLGEDTFLPPRLLYPADLEVYDQARPIRWQSIPWATGYRLQIGTAHGSSDVFESGIIDVPGVFPGPLPSGARLFCALSARIGEKWYAQHFSLVAAPFRVDPTQQVEAMAWLAGFVRGNARGPTDQSIPWSSLRRICQANGKKRANCWDYTADMIDLFSQMRILGQIERQQVAFINNGFDVHTFAHWMPAHEEKWMIVDPTFGFLVTDLGGRPVSALDMQQAVVDTNWSNIRFVPATDEWLTNVSGYYLDYAMLFQYVEKDGEMLTKQGVNYLPFLEFIETGNDTRGGSYVVWSSLHAEVAVMVDGHEPSVIQVLTHGFSKVFLASTVSLPQYVGGARLYRLRRPAFPSLGE